MKNLNNITSMCNTESTDIDQCVEAEIKHDMPSYFGILKEQKIDSLALQKKLRDEW